MIFAIKGRWEGAGGGQHTDVTERQSPWRSWGCLRRSQGGILILKPVLGSLTPVPSAWGPSRAVPVLGGLGQGVPVAGMGIQSLHDVRADPSPRSPEIWGCWWHLPAVLGVLLLKSFPFSFPLISMPPIFQSPPNGRCPDPL